ncbi:MAG: hypothetical protein ABIQ32_00440 [Sphingomicrobium sp.]
MPDVVLIARGRELIVEILVTHACDDEKIAKIRDQGKSALEIDLSAFRHAESEEAVAEALIGGTVRAAPRTWLYNVKVEQATGLLANELQQKAIEQETRRKEERQAATTRLLAAARSIRVVSTDATLADMQTVSAYGFSHLVGLRLEGPQAFRVPAKLWQSAIWARALVPASAERGTLIDPRYVLIELQDCIVPAFRNEPGGDVKDAVRKILPGFQFPSEALNSYLRALSLRGILEPEGRGLYRLEDQTSYSLDQQTEKLNAQAERHQQAEKRIHAILDSIPADERAAFSIDKWARLPIPDLGLRLADIVESGDGWGVLHAALSAIESLLRGGRPTDLTLGLPIGPAIDRAVAQEQAERDEAARLKQAADAKAERGRVDSLSGRAFEVLGAARATTWLATIASPAAHSFLELARQSEDGFHKAYDALRREERELVDQRRREKEAEKCRAELRGKAIEAFGAERAEVFLLSTHPRLGQSPWSRCTDALGLRDCVALFPRRASGVTSRSRTRR